MTNRMFPKGKEGLLSAAIRLDGTSTIKAVLLRGYTYNAAHQFVSDLGATVVATSPALVGLSITNGVVDADDTAWSAVAAGAACDSIALVQSSAVGGGADVAAGSQRLIMHITQRINVTAAALANSGATAITVDPLVSPLNNASTVVFGGVTATLTAPAAVGARTLAVSALSGSIPAGTVGLSSAQGGLPVTPTGANISMAWDNGANRIFSIAD